MKNDEEIPRLTPEKHVLDILAEMIAHDSELKVVGSYTGGESAGGINLSEMPPSVGLD